MNIRIRKFAVALSLLSGFATTLTVPAFAQATDKKDEPKKMDTFVVTGSYIPTNETAINAGVSPMVLLDRKVIDETGLTTTSELLQKITVSNGSTVPVSNNATGFTPAATSVSLRGLGGEATLVLINGRRVANYPIGNGGTTAFVDLNSIPLSAVDTIEILKDGASAVYGADAVAGVVNIKMRRGMDGTELMLNYGNTTNKDSTEFTAALVSGAQTDKASAMVGFNYYKKNAIFNRDREYSAVPPFLSSNSSPLNLNITRAAALAAGVPASSLPAGTAQSIKATSPKSSNNVGLTPATGYIFGTGNASTFNFNEFSMSYPRRDNRGMFAYAERKIFGTDNVKAFVDTSYSNAATENQLAPQATGNFTTAGYPELVIPAKTPNSLVLPDGRARATPAGAYNPFNPFNVDITGTTRARLAEFGNRIYRNYTDAIMLATGIKAENVMGKWNFDASYSYSSIKDQQRNTLQSASKFNRLMNANDSFFQPGSSDYVGTTIPYNPFGYYQVPIANNQLIAHFANVDVKDRNESSLNELNAVMSTGNLMDSPAGPIGFAFGADLRHEQLDQYPDPYSASGDLIGVAAGAQTHGQRKVAGYFTEATFPLLRNVPGAYDLKGTVAVRYEDFLTTGTTTTVPKFGLRWQPVDSTFTVRASWSKGLRQPSLYELYASPTSGLVPITHPLPGFAFEPEQAVTVSGNRQLAPEKTKYLNGGVIWSPASKGLKGLTLGVDYWEAERTGTVSVAYQDTLDRFFGRHPGQAAGSAPGGLVPGESVVRYADGSINVINSVFFNVGTTKAAGLDYSLNYLVKTDNAGRFEFSTVWSQYTHFKQTSVAGTPLVELVNQPTAEGTGSDNAYLRWKGRTQLNWAYKGYTAMLAGTFTDGFWDVDGITGADFRVKSTMVYDLQFGYSFHGELGRWLADTKLTVGARNLFDKDPPFASGNAGNSTGYPSFLYSSEGRFVYMSLSRKF